MKLVKFRWFSAVLSAALVPVSARAALPSLPQSAAPWLFEGSDIPVGPAWRFGVLPNGVRYAVRQNRYPAGTLAIRVRIDAGALMESEDEKGYAHFIEHMTFRGTKTVPDGEGIRIWQRLGARFGSDTNAFTSLTQTLYQLDLPRTDAPSVDTALTLLSEMVSSANFDPPLVEIERKVVTAERELRQPPLNKRIRDAYNALALAGTRAADADIAGTDATLSAASPARLRSFYDRWYRPERATVVIVGDADVAVLEDQVRRHFGAWTGRGSAPNEPDYGTPAQPKKNAVVIEDPRAPNELSLFWPTQHDDRPETIATETADWTRAIAAQVLARRINRHAREGGAFLSGGAGYGEQRRVIDGLTISLAPKQGQWAQALTETYAILADAIATLPSQDEIDQVVSNIEAGLQSSAAGAATMQSGQLANQLVNAVNAREVVADPGLTFDLFEAQRKAFTPENVGAALRTMIQGDARALLISPQPVAGGDAGLAAALAQARTTKAAARTAEKRVSLDDLGRPGAPGKILSRTTIPDLDVIRVKFENGVEVDLKRTGFEQAGVVVVALAGSGLTALDPKSASLSWTAPAIIQGGVGPLDINGLERALAGRRLGLSFGVTEQAFAWSGATTAVQLTDQLRLLDAAIREPRFDSNAFQRVRDNFVQNYNAMFATPASVFGTFGNQPLHNGDRRYGVPTRDEAAATTPETYRAFWQPLFAGGPRKVLIIGDIDSDAAIEAARQTFGAAVTKPAGKIPASHTDIRPPRRTTAPVIFNHRGDPNQMIDATIWATTGTLKDLRQARALNVAAQIIQTRLYDRFRETEGGTYSPAVANNQSETFADYGVVIAYSQIRAERQADFEKATREIALALAKDGPTADELSRAITPIVSGNERRRKLNGYWAQMLQGDLDDPRYVDLIRTGVSGYQNVTAAEVQAVARKWLTKSPVLRIEVKAAPDPR